MPIRKKALPPGEFIRNHLRDNGGVDYVQSIYRAYTSHLKDRGIKSRANRASFSKYIWVANQLGLIIFDHAGSVSRWGDEEDGGEIEKGYERESRPQAPSPRHYYRIVDDQDPRWLELEQSYRKKAGLPVPEPRERKPVAPALPAPKPEPVVKKRTTGPRTDPGPLIARAQSIIRELDNFLDQPSIAAFEGIEKQLEKLRRDVRAKLPKAKGKNKEKLETINYNISRTIESLVLTKGLVTTMETSNKPATKEKLRKRIAIDLQVIKGKLLEV